MTAVRCLIKYSPDIIEVTNYVTERLDMWRTATDATGRFKAKLVGDWVGSFDPTDPIQIRLDDVIFFEGYIDKGSPLAEGDAYQQYYEVIGRDYSQDLLNKQVVKSGDWMYPKQRADDIIDDMLDKASSEVLFTPDSVHAYQGTVIPEIIYTDRGDETLMEAFRKIFEYIDYDFYVDDGKTLNIFPIGSIDSGMTLSNISGSSSNNLLSLKKNEFDTYDLKNYIIAKTDKNDDGWTDGNAEDFVKLTGNSISDDYVEKVKGIGAIKCAKGSEDDLKIGLTFPLYNYDYLPFDLAQEEVVRFNVRSSMSIDHVMKFHLLLEDDGGHTIVWANSPLRREVWDQITTPMGTAVWIVDYKQMGYGALKWHSPAENQWQCHSDYPKGSFTWRITKMTWYVDKDAWSNEYVTDFYLDNLLLPFDMLSVAQDTISQGSYGVRDHSVLARNVRTQSELDELADNTLLKLKDPLYSLHVKALGSAGIVGGANKWIPGHMVTVNSPEDGISNEEYRMSNIHYIIDDALPDGHDFIVEADIVPKELSISGRRLAGVISSDVALLREISDRVRYFEKQEALHYDYIPPLPHDAASKILVGDFGNLSDTNVAWTRHYEAEDCEKDGEWTVETDEKASGGKVLQMSDLGIGKRIYFVDGPLGVIGELYFIVRMKVSDKTKSGNIMISLYDNEVEDLLGSVEIHPSMFPANDKFHHFALRAEVDADQQNIQFRLIVTKGDDFTITCDYGAIVPANLPIGYSDVTTSDHIGTDVSAHGGTDTDAHSDTDTDAHADTDTDAHGGTDTDAHTGSDAAIQVGLTVAGAYSSQTSNSITFNTWEELTSFEVPDADHQCYYVNVCYAYAGSGAGVDFVRAQYTSGSTYYYPFESGIITRNSAGGTKVGRVFITIPKNVKGQTLQIYMKRGLPAGDVLVYVDVSAWGHSHHDHTMTNPSNHSVTQPSNHSVTQPSNHSVTQPSNHSVTQPDNHSITQPDDHTTEGEGHEH